MTWLVRIVVFVLALIAVVVVVGYALPQSHRAQSRAEYRQPADSVWTALRDMARYPEWWSQLETSELEAGSSPETWIQKGPRVGTLPIHIVAETPPRELVTRIGEGLPFGGTWRYEVEPTASGALLTVTEDGEIYNPIFRFVSRFLMGYHGTMDSFLVDMGHRFGETVTPQHPE